MVSGITLSGTEEAIGIARAAKAHDLPVAISFTTDKGGCLMNGKTLRQAIAEVDAATGAAPIYYMINCSHPSDFEPASMRLQSASE